MQTYDKLKSVPQMVTIKYHRNPKIMIEKQSTKTESINSFIPEQLTVLKWVLPSRIKH